MSLFKKICLYHISLALIAVTFLVDLYVPLGSLTCGPYAFAVLLASLGASRSWVAAMAFVSVSLTVVSSLCLANEPADTYAYLTTLTCIAVAFPFGMLYCVHRSKYSQQRILLSKLEAMGCETQEIAHSLSNVLQVVLGLSYMLQEDLDAEDPHQNDLKVILSSARDGSTLTERLSLLGRQVPKLCHPVTSQDMTS